MAGTPKVVDGDTLDFAGARIELHGIDAPESSQTCQREGESWACGEDAITFLRTFLKGHEVSCQPQADVRDGNVVAACTRGSLDLSAVMIEAGLAVALDSAPAAYHDAQALRQQHKMGLWGSDFERPDRWRAANPAAVTPPSPAMKRQAEARMAAKRADASLHRQWRNQFGCAIKGNHSRRGEWIYHLPGRPYYAQTKAEALFCTEADAQAAGYRRSKA
ncbi:thermonuclease family protein [Parerythrobacter jejuensis]|uniref:TNase-like domain-containing protein n=1 Tax=Parerythrobacter jejuensis TaxID=795812 RepID=A0A845ASJ8_9SPHN|nr:thermonuclease family protein [Parerythrobacter jejuensis]MXP32564.1 hypothetical protein [Parerythrobacter jejuensis]